MICMSDDFHLKKSGCDSLISDRINGLIPAVEQMAYDSGIAAYITNLLISS